MNRRPRVILFAPHFAEYACRLALGLSRRADVLLFADRRNLVQECDDDLIREVEAAVQLVRFGSVGRQERSAALASVVLQTVRFRPDVVHVQEQPDRLTAWVARYVGRFHRMLLTVHDPQPHSGSDSVFAHRARGFRDTIRAMAHAFHVHGAHCAGALASTLSDGRPILDTPHGVLMVPKPGERAEPEPGRILFFGRMEAYKGIDTLLDATEILEGRQVPFRLAMAGRGPELDRLRSRIEASRSIELMEGFVEAATVRREIARCMALTAPYHDASQSGVVSAAFGGGRPVIASRAGGLSDAISHGENGLLFTPGSPTELADALERVVRDEPFARRLGAGAVRSAAGPFDWAEIAAEMLDFQKREMMHAA